MHSPRPGTGSHGASLGLTEPPEARVQPGQPQTRLEVCRPGSHRRASRSRAEAGPRPRCHGVYQYVTRNSESEYCQASS